MGEVSHGIGRISRRRARDLRVVLPSGDIALRTRRRTGVERCSLQLRKKGGRRCGSQIVARQRSGRSLAGGDIVGATRQGCVAGLDGGYPGGDEA